MRVDFETQNVSEPNSRRLSLLFACENKTKKNSVLDLKKKTKQKPQDVLGKMTGVKVQVLSE